LEVTPFSENKMLPNFKGKIVAVIVGENQQTQQPLFLTLMEIHKRNDTNFPSFSYSTDGWNLRLSHPI